jgi:hypothetical protein
MAIDAKCPHCEKPYRLKDELAGKKVTCANQSCRQVFTITPTLNGNGLAPAAPAPKKAPAKAVVAAVDADELAAAAFKDDPDEIPEDQKKITVKCEMCETGFEVAWAMQGKFALCTECKHRQKVPMQETGKIGGWREREGPQGRKLEELEGVQASTQGKMVGKEALEKGGAITVEYEDRPLSFYVKWAALGGLLLALAVGSFLYLKKNRETAKEEKVTADYDKVLDSDELKSLPGYQAALRISLGEAEARTIKNQKDRDQAIAYFTGALANLRTAPAPRGDAEQLYSELALAMVHLGGSGEDLVEKRRLSWLPPAQAPNANAKIKPNQAEAEGVQGQVRRVLQALRDAESTFDTRSDAFRRLTREFLKVGQPEVVYSAIPTLFQDAEIPEAEGQYALECHRGGKADLAQQIAAKLKAGGPAAAAAPSVQALNALLAAKPLSPGAEPADQARFAATALALVQNNAAEAKAIATRGSPTQAVSKLRALALATDWSEKPNEFLDAAGSIARDEAKKTPITTQIPGVILLRLAQGAARSGMADRAEDFVKLIPDENLKVFARAEVLRHRLAVDRSQPAKDDEAEIPADADPKKLKLGHAWGRLQLARHNGYKGDVSKLASAYAKWPKNLIAPFGQVGLTLGSLDAAQK